jgi:hypothetical protein
MLRYETSHSFHQRPIPCHVWNWWGRIALLSYSREETEILVKSGSGETGREDGLKKTDKPNFKNPSPPPIPSLDSLHLGYREEGYLWAWSLDIGSLEPHEPPVPPSQDFPSGSGC